MTEEKKKYARIVIEEEIPENATEDEILHRMEGAICSFISDHWGIDDIKIHERPYNQDKKSKGDISSLNR